MKVTKENEEMMGRGSDEKHGNGRTVVVGIKMDVQSRDLLTWALVKVVQPGDSVIATHVLPVLPPSFDHGNPPASISLLKTSDSVLAVYEGFCNLKQIDLKLSLCRDSSIRKALVREARSHSASKLILGASKKNHGIGTYSIAKYCAKKLTDECLVLAVNSGKIIFQREARRGSINGRNSHVTSSKGSVLLHGSNDNKFCLLPAKKNGSISLRSYSREKKSCSVSPVVTNCASDTQFTKEHSLELVPVGNTENSQRSISLLIQSLPEARPGWPLLQKAVLHSKMISCEKSNMSVVQLGTPIPCWYPSSLATIHPVQKPPRLQIKAIDSLDSKSRAIVLSIDVPRPSVATSNGESPKLPKELESLHEKYASTCRLFTFEELAKATSNFSPENFIGKGGSSRVYKGVLPDGRESAVKILKQTENVLKEFVLELEIITTLHHKNIISLNGFCFDGDKLLLVYDFMSRGSLEENLHGERKNKNSIRWTERYKLAVVVAEALDYLHAGGSVQPVIHRDVKSSNILLSDDYEAQLSDFGLATWISTSSQLTCSDVAGTFGYLAPEYFMFGKVSEKIDVYAFGVVLLELLSGRKPIENQHPKGQESLVMWAKPILQSENFMELLDPSLGSKYDEVQMERMILAASLCIRRAPRSRPNIATVLKLLQGDDADVINWARLQVNASEAMEESEDGTVTCSPTDFQSHLNLALLDVEDDTLSVGDVDHTVDYIMAHSSLEAYLQGRWSRSSSFN